LKVLQVAAGLDEPGAGPSYSVRRLGQALAEQGLDVELHGLLGWRGPPREDGGLAVTRHRQDFGGWPVLGRLAVSQHLNHALARSGADVIHAHGLWLMPDIYPARACRRTGAAFVLSPRGMLGGAALRFSRARKRLIWALLQARAARDAAVVHATSEAEFEEIRAFGLSNPVAVIANGVDLGQPRAPAEGRRRTVITLGRIHPKKGLPNLVEAWSEIQSRFPDWRLRIIGPDEDGHAASLAAQVRALGLDSVSIEGPLFGEAKQAAYAQADLFVLPTLNENFAMTVAEAMAAGLPAIVTRGAPWSELDAKGCGWWIEIGADPLTAALSQAMALPDETLRAMGEKGRLWMAQSYAWPGVARSMAEVYRWLRGEADRPTCVRLD
jgi:glycosyltransferase involved in cell wall biosynthesis